MNEEAVMSVRWDAQQEAEYVRACSVLGIPADMTRPSGYAQSAPEIVVAWQEARNPSSRGGPVGGVL